MKVLMSLDYSYLNMARGGQYFIKIMFSRILPYYHSITLGYVEDSRLKAKFLHWKCFLPCVSICGSFVGTILIFSISSDISLCPSGSYNAHNPSPGIWYTLLDDLDDTCI